MSFATNFSESVRIPKVVGCREVVFIDGNLPQHKRFLDGLQSDVEGVILNDREPAPIQIARALAQVNGLDALHIVSQGQSGAVQFKASALSAIRDDDYPEEWHRISRAITSNGRIAIWSCVTLEDMNGCGFLATSSKRVQ